MCSTYWLPPLFQSPQRYVLYALPIWETSWTLHLSKGGNQLLGFYVWSRGGGDPIAAAPSVCKEFFVRYLWTIHNFIYIFSLSKSTRFQMHLINTILMWMEYLISAEQLQYVWPFLSVAVHWTIVWLGMLSRNQPSFPFYMEPYTPFSRSFGNLPSAWMNTEVCVHNLYGNPISLSTHSLCLSWMLSLCILDQIRMWRLYRLFTLLS